MCSFCENFTEHKKYGIAIRNAYANGNFCEVLRDTNCGTCNGCADKNFHFTLYKWRNLIQLGFIHEIPECTVAQTSEHLQINYCPWCGEKLTDEIVPFEKCCVEEPFPVDW